MTIQIAKPILGELPNPAAPGQDGLVYLAWMNEGAGSMVNDSSGNRNEGNSQGALEWSAGVSGRVLNPTSTGNYINLNNTISFADGSPWSVVWGCKMAADGNQGMVCDLTDGGDDYIWHNGGDYIRVRTEGNTDFTDWTSFTDHHRYALTVTTGKLMSIYRDGMFGSSASPGNTSLDIDILLGFDASSVFHFLGEFEFIAFFNRTLSRTGVVEMHTNPKRFLGYTQEEDIIQWGDYAAAAVGNPWWYYELQRKVG